jgi:hypothetical protein
MKFDSGQAVLGAFLFLLPGFVWSAVYAALIPRKADSEQIRFMEFFALSSLNNAFWSWAIYLMYRGGFYEKHPISSALAVFLIVFVSPLAAALVTAIFRQKGWAARFIDSLGFKTARHNTTAWDFKFSSTAPVWVNVLLKDGNRIYGCLAPPPLPGIRGRLRTCTWKGLWNLE